MQTRALPPLLDIAGRPLQLGPQLGSGGEGAVFELRDRSDLVAKLYHKRLEPEKAAKIAHMAKAANERLLKLTAWPTEPIYAGSGARPVVGFTMPKITGHKEAFNLHSPKLRLREFPTATWPFLIRSAANAARIFNAIHESGHVIGDVNEKNLLVGNKATARLIDCDSFQITVNGSRWLCEVGVPTHQPPELQNVKTYKGIVRTPNHDNFGLAVIVFQMLFMARHPFAGRFLGAGEMPMERAISEYRFAYGSNAPAMQIQPPPASLGLNGVTRDMALLFERAFAHEGSQPNGRPTAREWAAALQDLETHLKKCSINPAHQFVDSLSKCPWCDIEAASGVPLFTVALGGSAQSSFTIADFWRKVTSLPNPGPSPALPRVEGRTVTLSPQALEIQQATWGARLASGLFALIGGATRIVTLKKGIEKNAVEARSRWQNIQNNWTNYTSATDFDEQYIQLQNLRGEHDALPQKRLQAFHYLEMNRHQLQLHAHLDSCRILHARIRGIGDARKATLQSYGIETAADISVQRVLSVPGFGPVALNNLTNWRNQQERRFRFDPNKGVDPMAKNKVEREILTTKIDLERKLGEALSKLTVTSHHILSRRKTLLAQAEEAAASLAQAEADLRAVSSMSPIVPGKRVIAIIGAVSVGGLIIASNQNKGPQPTLSQPVTTAQPIPSPAATPVPPLRPTLPPHVVIGPGGQRLPEDGYDWANTNHINVRWREGKASRKNLHVVASDTEGEWQPEDGYAWVSPDKPDKVVRWAPGTPSSRYPNVVAATVEGQWQPAEGYAWVINPHRSEDMRVIAINAWLNRIINPAAPTTAPSAPASSPFDQGVADRAAFEQWVSGLSGEVRRGVDWWAARRSIQNPGSCGSPAGTSSEFVAGCEAAKARLTPVDAKRKSDPKYRRGWNTYRLLQHPPPPIPPISSATSGPPIPLLGQSAPLQPTTSDEDQARRLNERELQRLQGR